MAAAGGRKHQLRKVSKVSHIARVIAVKEFGDYGAEGGSAEELRSRNDLGEEGCKERQAVVQCRFHKAFLFTLIAFGAFHPFRLGDCGSRWRLPALVYCTLVVAFTTFNALRLSLTVFGAYESAMPGILYIPRLTFLSWHMVVVLTLLAQYATCFAERRGVSTYYRRLDETVRSLRDAGMEMNPKSKRRLELLCLAIGWSLYVFYVAISLPNLVDRSQLDAVEPVLRWRLDNSTSAVEREVLRAIEITAVLYGSGAYIFPVVYVVVITGHLTLILNSYNSKLEEIATSHPDVLLKRIGSYRRLHLKICETIACANDILDYMIGLHLFINFVLSILQLYFIVNVNSLTEFKALQSPAVLWLIISVSIMTVEFTGGCVITEKAKACEEHLRKITGDSVHFPTTSQLVELQLFLNQLKQDRGFNVIGLLPINRESLIPIVGAYVTYFLLVAQYGPPTSSSSPAAIAPLATAMNVSFASSTNNTN